MGSSLFLTSLMDRVLDSWFYLLFPSLCLMHYMYSLYQLMNHQREKSERVREIADLEGKLKNAEFDCQVVKQENEILKDLMRENSLQKSMDLILSRFVTQRRTQFAAFINCQTSTPTLWQHRGLAPETVDRFDFDESFLQQVGHDRFVYLQAFQLSGTQFWNSLSIQDRGKAETLYMIAIGDPGELQGIFMTTHLIPEKAPQRKQVELMRKVMTCFAGTLRRAKILHQTEDQLRSTIELLELRSVADKQHQSPFGMMEEFLECLLAKVGGERAALFVQTPGTEGQPIVKAIVRCGIKLQPGVESRWHSHEQAIGMLGVTSRELQTLSEVRLRLMGIDTLIGRAVVVPLKQRQPDLSGCICISQRSRTPLTPDQIQLVEWAADHLSESLLRALNHLAVERQAKQDGLTGLANRRSFDQIIEHEMSRVARSEIECSLLLLDLDRFKSVNDTYGHQAGDEVLRSFGKLLLEQVQQVRSEDRVLVARYGGEEMAILLPGIGLAGATRIAESIRASLEALTIPLKDGQTLKVTTSIGISTAPRHGKTVAEMIASADAALYHAKESGRNRACCVSEVAPQKTGTRM